MSRLLTAADLAQLRASAPWVSAFVDASAGSGKTKLFIDRILRLMLDGADPSKIVGLTYTKAAAAEMSLRLRAVLAAWVTADEEDLKVALVRLSVDPTPKKLAFARSLFGVVLDLPGGINLGTIHSFCQSMLRRFPLEAQVSPHFQIEDDAAATLRRQKAKDAVIGDIAAADDVAVLAGEQNDEQFTNAMNELLNDPEALVSAIREYGADGVIAQQREALGLGGLTDDMVWAGAIAPDAETDLLSALEVIKQLGTAAAGKIVEPGLAWLKLDGEGRKAAFATWKSVFLTLEGTPRDVSKLANKALREGHPAVLEAIQAEQARLFALNDRVNALVLARVSASLVSLVAPILEAEERVKASKGRLDYSDLITKTARLLVDPGAAWVLFKMDGGLDHILIDEVQDVSPAQWRIIGPLLDDFFSGQGAHDKPRTIFAVGDVKQSIYSFQGADLDSFSEWHEILRQKVREAGQEWVDGELNTSFRSSAGILDVVDSVFTDPDACRGVSHNSGAVIRHQVSRSGQAGSVTLWPLAPRVESEELPDWAVADDYHTSLSSRRRLAQGVADWLSRAIGNYELWSRGRTMRAGDVLVLVRSRNEFGDALVPALKDAGIPVAGLDRLTLADSRAVADLIAFAEAVTLPANDMAVASYLASPLGNLSDESLMELAIGRSGSLIGALFKRCHERQDWQGALDLYVEMQARADFVSPYHFFAELLGKHNGRAKLARRLGPDALEPIDEFLAAALRYSACHTPTMRGFLHSVENSAAEIKRETDVSADAVRIMTVHGAKGLQAPVVIMPDTVSKPSVKERLFWLPGAGRASVPVLCPRGKNRTQVIERQVASLEAEEIAEHNRLLYVALTRAEDHLIVCGAETAQAVSEESWYASIKRGLQRLPGVRDAEGLGLEWGGAGLVYSVNQNAAPDMARRITTAADDSVLPGWVGPGPDYTPAPPAADPDPIDRIVPSRIGDEDVQHERTGRPAFGVGQGRSAALQRGTLIHALLQHLPACAADEAEVIAADFLASRQVPEAEIQTLASEALRVMRKPEIAAVFGPGSHAEVPIVGIVGDAEIAGVIDRMHVADGVVTIVDFKSDRRPPAAGDEVPSAYVKQVKAYTDVLRVAFPGMSVRAFIAWTANGHVIEV